MKITFDSQTLDLTPTGKTFRAVLEGKTIEVEVIRVDAEQGKLDLRIDGEHVTAYVSSDGTKRWVTANGQTLLLTKSTAGARKSSGHDHASD